MSANDEAASTPAVSHEPPSLPASPLPKRTKVIDPTPSALSAVSTAPDSGTATPTPSNMTTDPTASLLPSALSVSSSSAAPKLEVQFLSPKGRAPTRGSAFAAGHDIYSAEDVVVPARGRAKVATDISISVPAGTYGRIAPRSGLAAKHGIDTLAGVIDADYRGPVGILLANLSDDDFQIKEGDRIAQLILEQIVMPEVVVVEKLVESVRGAGGFGSTGGFGAV